MVRARAITKDETPTFATQGLEFFNRYYKQTYEQRKERNAPQMLLFFVLETLNRADLSSMANNLVEISTNSDVFSFIFIANPEGASSYEKATVSLPHDSWNSLAVDDSSDILKYRDVLRRCMCRAAKGDLCLMGKEAKKVTEKGIIQRSAFMRKPTVRSKICGRLRNLVIFGHFQNNFQNCLVGSPFGLVLFGNFENFDFLAENYSENGQK